MVSWIFPSVFLCISSAIAILSKLAPGWISEKSYSVVTFRFLPHTVGTRHYEPGALRVSPPGTDAAALRRRSPTQHCVDARPAKMWLHFMPERDRLGPRARPSLPIGHSQHAMQPLDVHRLRSALLLRQRRAPERVRARFLPKPQRRDQRHHHARRLTNITLCVRRERSVRLRGQLRSIARLAGTLP